MFGIIRPCRHRLSEGLHADWLAHLCGLCLALRDEHGQLARVVTNHDGLVVSALVEAQVPGGRRRAGPCPLRGMRGTSVSHGDGARLAAAVSLVLASAKIGDHAEDGDGVFGRRAVAGAGRRMAARWTRQAGRTGAGLGFDTAVLAEAVAGQAGLERAIGTGDPVLVATGPTERATAAAFAHTAVLSGVAANEAPLREAGRLFGRVAHLLDAVEDQAEDERTGAWNPLVATGTSRAGARRLCDDAVLGVRLALDEAVFADATLVHALLVHELRHSVARTFARAAYPGGPSQHGPQGSRGARPAPGQWAGPPGAPGPTGPPEPPSGGAPDPYYDGKGGGCWVPRFRVPAVRRNLVFGCAVAAYQCGTCQVCCRDPYPGPWSGKPIDASRPDCCDGCDCCDCACDC
ncbi:DUF5685 family protein [Amycolatopsis minnesotensis]|uniref:DUF5685 family protein n=1 Tax=Amycolatopsis minnesotensis TaxID=337894 RepID=A0ABP5BVY8_9PSEU